jgi:myo-inositol-1(or 4)-monophosphatase
MTRRPGNGVDESTVTSVVAAAQAAGRALLEGIGDTRRRYKMDREMVTQSDLMSERLLRESLDTIFPGLPFIGEESFDGQLPDENCFWLVDPLDGTNNFAHGYPVFSVSIALVEDGSVSLGCVHDPLRDETFFAIQGGGASLNGERISVSATTSISDALIATGFPYHRREEKLGFSLEPLEYFLRRAQGIRRGGSAALDLSYVACGRLDGFYEEHLKPWDMAAGALLVKEAGGLLSAFRMGGGWSITSGGIVASAPGIFEEMLNGTS